MAFKTYADVQNALNTFVKQAGVTPGQAQHGVFWMKLTYDEFTSGPVPGVSGGPGVNGGWRICVPGTRTSPTLSRFYLVMEMLLLISAKCHRTIRHITRKHTRRTT